MSGEYLQELLQEKDLLDPNTFVHSIRLIENEILIVTKQGNREEDDDSSHGVDGDSKKTPKYHSYTGAVVKEDVVKLSEKVFIPVKEYPKFNFVGKLLGPRGNTLKRLQQATQTRMSVLGKGSTRNKEKEEELRNSDDAKYEHLKDPLHVLIEVEAPRSEAHARLAAALAEIKKYMVPENDEIRQEQMREMAVLNSIGKGTDTSALAPMLATRGHGIAAAPIVRVGIPPPGAIILNGQASLGLSAPARVLARGGRPLRPVTIPRHGQPAPERYASYDAYDATYDAAYEGYPETREMYLEYEEKYANSVRKRRSESTQSSSSGNMFKQIRSNSYGDVTYPNTDTYRGVKLR